MPFSLIVLCCTVNSLCRGVMHVIIESYRINKTEVHCGSICETHSARSCQAVKQAASQSVIQWPRPLSCLPPSSLSTSKPNVQHLWPSWTRSASEYSTKELSESIEGCLRRILLESFPRPVLLTYTVVFSTPHFFVFPVFPIFSLCR